MNRFTGKRCLHQGLAESPGNGGRIRGEQAAMGLGIRLEDRKEGKSPT